jgi:hypothetical protein
MPKLSRVRDYSSLITAPAMTRYALREMALDAAASMGAPKARTVRGGLEAWRRAYPADLIHGIDAIPTPRRREGAR